MFKKILVIPKTEGIEDLFKKAPKKSTNSALLDGASAELSINQLISKWQGPVPDFVFIASMEPKPLLALKTRGCFNFFLTKFRRITHFYYQTEDFESEFDDLHDEKNSDFDPQNWSEWLVSAQCPPEAPTSTDSEDLIKLLQISDRIKCNRTELFTQTSG